MFLVIKQFYIASLPLTKRIGEELVSSLNTLLNQINDKEAHGQ